VEEAGGVGTNVIALRFTLASAAFAGCPLQANNDNTLPRLATVVSSTLTTSAGVGTVTLDINYTPNAFDGCSTFTVSWVLCPVSAGGGGPLGRTCTRAARRHVCASAGKRRLPRAAAHRPAAPRRRRRRRRRRHTRARRAVRARDRLVLQPRHEHGEARGRGVQVRLARAQRHAAPRGRNMAEATHARRRAAAARRAARRPCPALPPPPTAAVAAAGGRGAAGPQPMRATRRRSAPARAPPARLTPGSRPAPSAGVAARGSLLC
jgi:hypothetical protein